MLRVRESFRKFVANVNIADRQEQKVANCKNNVIAKLSAKLDLNNTSETRAIGSWDRDTMVPYLSEGDVDVMTILH